MASIIVWAIVIIVLAAIAIVVLALLYQRATREVSLVKTGIGGRKVVMDGGTIAIPYFHHISRVNMKTLRLEVHRSGESSFITKDRLRVDIQAEFYLSVIPTEDGIARAAQTLGERTFHADQLRQLIEGKLLDALRGVAAQRTMDELHENRPVFVAEVRDQLSETLAHNGLELDNVALTEFDQTAFRDLDENNAFNAVGMRRLAEVIATSKKERAEIDNDAEVSVLRARMEAAKRKLEIDLSEEEARIVQQQEIERLRASQGAEITRQRADAELASEQARINKEREVRETEIAQERVVKRAEIVRDLELQSAEIARDRDVEIANQERQIATHKKSEEESSARAAADIAKAEAARAAEAVSSARQIAEAERIKQIAMIEATREAESTATRIRLAADAERDAAASRAEARLEEARADADSTSIRAEANKNQLLAEAEGQRQLIDAENALGDHIVAMRVDLAKLETLPRMIAEMVKPAEKIESIRIHQMTGFGGGATAGQSTSSDKPVVNQALDSIMDMAVQLPALKKIGEELGMSLDDGISNVSTDRPTPSDGGDKS